MGDVADRVRSCLQRWYWSRRLLAPTWLIALLSVLLFATLLTEQSGEVLAAAANPATEDGLPLVAVYLGTLLLAVSSWYGARLLLNMDYRRAGGERRIPEGEAHRRSRLRSWAARGFGLLPFAVVASGFAKAEEWRNVAGVVAGGALFFAFVVWRRCRLGPQLWIERPRRISIYVGCGVLAVNGLVFALLLWFPVRAAHVIGTAGILLFAFSGWIALGSALVDLGYRCCHRYWLPPLAPIALIAVLAIAAAFLPDNHPIRAADCAGHRCASGRMEPIEEHFRAWLAARDRGRERIPVVLVTAEGGGLRAAYWTASVLGRLSHEIPGFACHVYAVSGASGGSIGAAIWLALLSESVNGVESEPRADCERYPHPLELAGPAQRVFARDLLAPAIGALLTRDLVGYFLPVQLQFWEDRAAVFERGIEDACRHHRDESAPFRLSLAADFRTPSTVGFSRPALPSQLLKRTRERTGGPATLSNLDWSHAALDGEGHPDGTIDLYPLGRRLGYPISISTAIHAGARFPVVSPPGAVSCSDHDGGERDLECHQRAGKRWDRIVDGGYFENSGAFAALEVKGRLRQLCLGRCRFLHVAITNDPKHPEVIRESCAQDDDGAGCPTEKPGLECCFNPFQTLLRGWSAWRMISEHRFLRPSNDDTLAFAFRLRPSREHPNPALGWLLDAQSQTNLQEQADALAVGPVRRAFAEES